MSTVDATAEISERVHACQGHVMDLGTSVQRFVPLASTLIHQELSTVGYAGQSPRKRRETERWIANRVRESQQVTFFANPWLWWQIGVMVARLIAFLWDEMQAKRAAEGGGSP